MAVQGGSSVIGRPLRWALGAFGAVIALAVAILDNPLCLLVAKASPAGLLALTGRPDLAAWGLWSQRVADHAVILGTAVILAARLHRSTVDRHRLAVDRHRLATELSASQRMLRHSRGRLVEAADRERRRIAQDLHDGLQPRLVMLALEAQRLASRPGLVTGVAEAALALRTQIDTAAGELRELVYAVMPAPLIEQGLGAATEDLADRTPVPTELDLRVDGPLPDLVASTAYFVVAEALANAVKHAGASRLAVQMTRQGSLLTVEVSDDGVGGAVPGGGLGLRSLADRVEALGGLLAIDSPVGRGTRLVAELPCAS
jgi:signal transduction histidine kinase